MKKKMKNLFLCIVELLLCVNLVFRDYFLIFYYESYPSLLRRVRQVRLLGSEELTRLIQPVVNKIKALVFDLDGTLNAGLGKEIDAETIQLLNELAKMGINISIITGGDFPRLSDRLLRYLPADFPLERLYLYANTGAVGFGFSPTGQLIKLYEVDITPEQRRIRDDAITKLKEKLKDEIKEITYRGKTQVVFRIREGPRQEEFFYKAIEFMEGYLSGTDFRAMSGEIGKAFDISLVDKSWAAKDLMKPERAGLKAEEMIIVGDSFSGKYSNDRAMMVEGALVFNVGDTQDLPAGLYSLATQGFRGTEELLSIIIQLKKQSP
jgi:HAD superfamily hydrolase (TIGR01484 family)